MSDFEVAIINACALLNCEVKACFFHLRQSVLRQIQTEGLKTTYVDENDRTIKMGSSMMTALVYLPVEDVEEAFDVLYNEADKDFILIMNYFETNYIRGKKARGRKMKIRIVITQFGSK